VTVESLQKALEKDGLVKMMKSSYKKGTAGTLAKYEPLLPVLTKNINKVLDSLGADISISVANDVLKT